MIRFLAILQLKVCHFQLDAEFKVMEKFKTDSIKYPGASRGQKLTEQGERENWQNYSPKIKLNSPILAKSTPAFVASQAI